MMMMMMMMMMMRGGLPAQVPASAATSGSLRRLRHPRWFALSTLTPGLALALSLVFALDSIEGRGWGW